MNVDGSFVAQLVPILITLFVIQVALIIAALYDLTRPGRRVRGDSKVLWAVVILLFQLLGPLVYFLIGREDD